MITRHEIGASYPIEECHAGEQVWIAEDASDWIGVEIVSPRKYLTEGSVLVRVVWTADIPGYEVGQKMKVDADVLARRELTVNALVAQREKRFAGTE